MGRRASGDFAMFSTRRESLSSVLLYPVPRTTVQGKRELRLLMVIQNEALGEKVQ